MNKKQIIRIYEKPKYKCVEEINMLSQDEKEFLEILNPLVDTLSGKVDYHPNAFSDLNEDDDSISYLKCNLGGDFVLNVYFKHGVYDSWIFKNNIYRDDSNDKDKWKKEKAKEKIAYILEQYAIYEEARYNISKHIDNIYF